MSRFDWLALALSFLAALLSAWVSLGVYQGLAQLEDEYAYQWQAQLLASAGALKTPSPPEAESFLIPFVIDFEGQRFSKYPLGWPVLLAFGARLGFIRWVNPLLAGLIVWLSYRLGQKLIGNRGGLLTAGLTAISPFFLTYSGSLLSHTWGLTLSLSFTLAWLDLTEERPRISGGLLTLLAGAALGLLALSRPWTAFGVALPFGLHGLLLLGRGPIPIRKRVLGVGLIAILIGSLYFVWQYALTGDLLRNPYLLWWPYDRVGFGAGVGLAEGGHTLRQARLNTVHSLRLFWPDLFGWGRRSWLLLLLGAWALRRKPRAWLAGAAFPALVGVYLAYWVSGPRYFYEGLHGLVLFGAAGVSWLAGWLPGRRPGAARLRQGIVLASLAALLIFGTLPYGPARWEQIWARYGFSQAALAPFETPEALARTPALVIVQTRSWKDYGAYLHLQNPQLSSPFIFAWAAPGEDPAPALARHFPGRAVYYYDPARPGEFLE